MNFENAVNIEDLRHCARSHVPRAVLGYVEGGVEDGIGMARNRAAFDAVRLVGFSGAAGPVSIDWTYLARTAAVSLLAV